MRKKDKECLGSGGIPGIVMMMIIIITIIIKHPESINKYTDE